MLAAAADAGETGDDDGEHADGQEEGGDGAGSPETGATAISKRECIAQDQSALRTRSASQGAPRLAAFESRALWTCPKNV